MKGTSGNGEWEKFVPGSPPAFVIYALADPRTHQIRYLGKSSRYLNSRFRAHLHEAESTTKVTHKLSWIRQLARSGLIPEVWILERADSKECLPDLERQWIARLRADGVRLTNMTDGGEGLPNPSPETRAKLRAKPKLTRTPEQREQAREQLTERWKNPEFRERMRAANDARRIHPKREVLKGEELRRFKIDNAVRMGHGNRGLVRTPEQRAKIAAGVKRAYEEGRLVSPFAKGVVP